MSSDVFNIRKDIAVALVLGTAVTLLCIVSGPGTIDGMDGPELAAAGYTMEIPHSPGYPLLMWLLRLSGGRGYNSLRVFGCLIAGLATCGVYSALRSFRIKTAPSAAGSLLLVSSGAVMSQLNILEVHSLSLLLASLALVFRETRLGPYAMSMSVFGGHPLSMLLLPMTINRRWRRTWPLAILPATMWLYIPLRAQTAMVIHYGAPKGIQSILKYMTMYGGRITAPSFSGLWEMACSLGPVTIMVFLLAVLLGRFNRRVLFSLAGVFLIFLFYGISDVQAYSWLFLLPLTVVAAAGFQRLYEKRRFLSNLLMICLVTASIVSGVLISWDSRGDAMQIITEDLLRGVPLNRVICTNDVLSYSCAYLIKVEDRRPDLLPFDRNGLFFSFSLLNGPLRELPSEIAGRYVYAVGDWGNLPPSGLLFSAEGIHLAWERYDIFSKDIRPAEALTGNILAEFWALRALQEDSHDEILAAFRMAQEFAESQGAKSAVNHLIDNYLNSLQ